MKNQQMIHLIPIERNELRPLVTLAFKDDAELLDIVAPKSLETLIEDNLSQFNEYGDEYGGKYYEIKWLNISIGFTVTLSWPDPKLLSFGINIKFRKKSIVLEWLNAVEKQFNSPFSVHLYLRNIRAIKFFQRNGFNKSMVTEASPENFISLWQ